VLNEQRIRLIALRVRGCEQVEIEGVEHVRLDGFDHYLASSLLESLMDGLP